MQHSSLWNYFNTHLFTISLLSLVMVVSIIATIAGFGIGTVLMPIFLYLRTFSYLESLFIVAIIHWWHSLFKSIMYRTNIDWRLIVSFAIPAGIASMFGAQFAVTKSELVQRLFGLVLISYVTIAWTQPTIRLPKNRLLLVSIGMIIGFMAGAFGVRGALRSAFLTMIGLSPQYFIGTSGVTTLIEDTGRLLIYAQDTQFWNISVTQYSLIFIPASLIGVLVGRAIADRMPAHQFRAAILLLLALVGIKLIIFP